MEDVKVDAMTGKFVRREWSESISCLHSPDTQSVDLVTMDSPALYFFVGKTKVVSSQFFYEWCERIIYRNEGSSLEKLRNDYKW